MGSNGYITVGLFQNRCARHRFSFFEAIVRILFFRIVQIVRWLRACPRDRVPTIIVNIRGIDTGNCDSAWSCCAIPAILSRRLLLMLMVDCCFLDPRSPLFLIAVVTDDAFLASIHPHAPLSASVNFCLRMIRDSRSTSRVRPDAKIFGHRVCAASCVPRTLDFDRRVRTQKHRHRSHRCRPTVDQHAVRKGSRKSIYIFAS